VQVGEQRQVLTQEAVLRRDGLLDLDEQVGGAPDVGGLGDDLGSRGAVGVVAEARPDAGSALDEHPVAVRRELVDARGRHADAALTVFDLCGNTDDHGRDSFDMVRGKGSGAVQRDHDVSPLDARQEHPKIQ
jgi:hypothetical protein